MSENESEIIISKIKEEHGVDIPQVPKPHIITESFSYQVIKNDPKDDSNNENK